METERLKETVARARRGDPNAMTDLYLDAHRSVYYLALRMVKNPEDAEDITQEVFITVQEKITELREPAAFYAWANQITANKCNRFLGKYPGIARMDDGEEMLAHIADDNPLNLPDKAIDDEATRQIILEVIDALPDNQRVCVMLFYYAQFTVTQIANTLETNENTVKSRLSLARAKIRAALEEKEKKEGIKLYGIPLALTPILRQAMEQFVMPDGAEARMWENIQKAASKGTPANGGNKPGTGGAAGQAATSAGMTLAAKIIIGIIAAAVIAAGAIFIPRLLDNPPEETPPPAVTDAMTSMPKDIDSQNGDAENPSVTDTTDDSTNSQQNDNGEYNGPVNERGNSTGNITNGGGRAAIQGDWIYYSDVSDNSRLYKMRTDGSEKVRLSANGATYINVVGDWVYFSNRSNLSKLYKIRINGTDETEISSDAALYINVVDGWIYYSSSYDDYRIYKIRTDGTEKVKINDENSKCINVVDNWIYYFGEKNRVCKVRTDGSEMVEIQDESGKVIKGESLNVVDDWIYYKSSSSAVVALAKINTNGGKETTLSISNISSVNVDGEWTYFSTTDDTVSVPKGLFKIHTDSLSYKDAIQISSGDFRSLNIVGDWIYYLNADKELYRINKDGTNRQIVD